MVLLAIIRNCKTSARFETEAAGAGSTNMLPLNFWITAFATAAAVVACVALHYECLRMLSTWLPSPKRYHRRRIVGLIICLMLIHIIEIWIFGATYFSLLSNGDFGELVGIGEITILNCVYYSAMTFTTVGFGDIFPQGPIRFLTGTEAISGLTLITWSASYTLMEMLKVWDDKNDK